MINSSIPDICEPRKYENCSYINSPFIEVNNENTVRVDMQYPKLRMKYAEERCFLRLEVYKMLFEAQIKLPKGVFIKILDAWRPFELQKELYKKYSQEIVKKFSLENETEEKKKEIISKYVSIPEKCEFGYPVHTTGGAVDVTLVDLQGNELNMGTGFDEMVQASQTNYHEFSDDDKVRNNRRMLYNVMVDVGFTNLPSEWWHFDYGDRFWAFYKDKSMIYKPVYESEGVFVEDCKKKG